MTTSVAIGKRVDIDFRGFFQELVDQHGARGAHQGSLRNIFLHGVDVVGDDHGPATKHVAGANQHGQTDFPCNSGSFFRHKRGAVAWLGNFQLIEEAAEAAAIFREIDGFWSSADDGHAVALEFQSEIERSLPAELHDHAGRLFAFDDGEHIFQR